MEIAQTLFITIISMLVGSIAVGLVIKMLQIFGSGIINMINAIL